MSQIPMVAERPNGQLLKWVGNKYRFAYDIVEYFPSEYSKFIEPFVGTGAIIGTLSPNRGIGGDTLEPLIEIWHHLQERPELLTSHYEKVINEYNEEPDRVYNRVLDRFNEEPNGLDLVILSRTCYGGVVRFTKDGRMSTPRGPHNPISPESFDRRVKSWRGHVHSVDFVNVPFEESMDLAKDGDLIYCDPPYVDTQAILYGSQEFDFDALVRKMTECKDRGARIALSIDGTKKSGDRKVELDFPDGLFEREVYIRGGSSMLRRFQSGGKTMVGEDVKDRLLLTY